MEQGRGAAGVTLSLFSPPSWSYTESVCFFYSLNLFPLSLFLSLRSIGMMDHRIDKGEGGKQREVDKKKGGEAYRIKGGNGKMKRGMGRHKNYIRVCWAISQKEIRCIATVFLEIFKWF